MSREAEEELIERLVKVAVDEGRRFTAESAWREREYQENERERRQVRIILAELRVERRLSK